jgi:mono/diheme cytochrome c family protein
MPLLHPIRSTAALALASLLAACGSDTSAPATSTGSDAGRAIYMSTCSACHQPEGRGLRGAFPPLAGSDWLASHPTEAAIATVLHGLSGPIEVNGERYNAVMPPIPHLSDEQVAAVLGYVYSQWGNDGRSVTAEQVAAVRRGETPAEAPATPGEPAAED